VLFDRVKVATATVGQGTITLGAAEAGFLSFAGAGVPDGTEVSYVIEEGAAWEIGVGTYDDAGTLTRGPIRSSNANAAIALAGAAKVFISARAADIAAPAIVDTFTSSGTWTKRTGLKSVHVVVIGGGAGGGSGRRGGSFTNRTGGGGGGGGGRSQAEIPASALPATVSVTVGAAAPGQGSATADDTNGSYGNAGNGSSFGDIIAVGGSPAGPPGTSGTVTGNTGGLGLEQGGIGGGTFTSSPAGAGGSSAGFAAGGGGGGGSISGGDAMQAPGAGGSNRKTGTFDTPGGGGAAGVSHAAAPSAGANGADGPATMGGMGGGGGGSSTGAAGGSGGNGGWPGGGAGAGGAVVVINYF
jgi:hypothetical protein